MILPLAILFSVVIYSVFALFYYLIEGWFGMKKVDIGSQKETIPLNSCKSMFDVGLFYSGYNIITLFLSRCWMFWNRCLQNLLFLFVTLAYTQNLFVQQQPQQHRNSIKS